MLGSDGMFVFYGLCAKSVHLIARNSLGIVERLCTLVCTVSIQLITVRRQYVPESFILGSCDVMTGVRCRSELIT
jgi:hypothetical protein